MPKVYVVTEPSRIRGIYETWPECEAAVKGVKGARYQAVASREQADFLGRRLTPFRCHARTARDDRAPRRRGEGVWRVDAVTRQLERMRARESRRSDVVVG